MRLNELTAGFDAFEAAIEANQGELTEELASQYDVLNLEQAKSVDGYVLYLRAKENEVAGFDAKRAHYQKLADEESAHKRAVETSIKWHLARIRSFMQIRGTKRLTGAQGFGFRIQGDGGKPGIEVLVATDQLPRRFLKGEPDKTALRNAIEAKDPEAILLARIKEPGEGVRIF